MKRIWCMLLVALFHNVVFGVVDSLQHACNLIQEKKRVQIDSDEQLIESTKNVYLNGD